MPYDIQHEADTMRALLQSAVDATAPAVVFHGHWHQRNRGAINNGTIDVLGLAADGCPGSAAILSIPDLQAHYLDWFRGPLQEMWNPLLGTPRMPRSEPGG